MAYSQFETAFVHGILDLLFSAQTLTLPASFYMGAGKSGDVEVSSAGYARFAIARNLTNFPAASARQKLLAVAQSFAAANSSVDWGTVEWVGLYDASTAGNRLVKIFLGGAPLSFLAMAADDLIRSAGHGLVDNQRVRFDAVTGVALPTGVAVATDYFVYAVDADTFKVRGSLGGAAIDLTGNGGGLVFAWRSKGVSDGDILNFAANDISIVWA